MLFNKHKYTFNASKKILHKIKKRWVVISLALLGLISGVALATSPINVNADNNGMTNQSSNITQQANQLHSQLMSNNVNNRQSTMKLGAELSDNNWNFFSDAIPNYSDSYSDVNLNSFSDNATNGSDNFDFNYLNNNNSALNSSDNNGINYSDNYSAFNSNYSNPFASYSDNYDYQSPSYSDTLTPTSSDDYLNNWYSNSDTNDLAPSYSDNFFNNYSNGLVSLSDNSDIWNIASDNIPSNSVNPYSDDYNNQLGYSYSDLNNSNLFSDYSDASTINSYADNYSDIDNLFPSSSGSSVFSNSTSDSTVSATSNDNVIVSSSGSVSAFNNVTSVTSSSNNSVSSDDVSDNSSDISNVSDVSPVISVDATHKYLIPNSNNQYVMLDSDVFSDVNNHELNSLYSDEKLNNVPLVHIINTKNLLGYQLDEISDVQPSDSDDVWVFSDELNNSNLAKFNGNELNRFNATLNNGYGTDTTHKYLISETNGKNVMFNSISSDGNYSDYTDSDNHAPLFIKIINSKSVFGYHFDQIIMNLNDASDSSDVSKEWVFSDELNNSPKASVNDVQEFQNFNNTVMNHYYTPSEITRINEIKQRYSYLKQYENSNLISNSTQIKAYRQHVIDWVNFYRSLYGYQPVTEDASFDQVAQKGADDDNDPEDLIEGDPSSSTASNPSDVGLYVTDADDVDHNGVPGHRISVLNPRDSKIGVGIKGSQDTLYFDFGENSPFIKQPTNISYPNDRLFPISDVNQNGSDYFGYAFISDFKVDSSDPDYYSPVTVKNPEVLVHDDTSNVDVSVSNVHTDDTDFNGETYSGAVYYLVDTNALRPNHQYTITISGQGIPNGKYTYTTKLFKFN